MIQNPEKFVLNSNFKYHKIIAKGQTDTTTATGVVTLYDGVPAGGTWLIGLYNEGTNNPGQVRFGGWGSVTPDGKLQVRIQRQSPVTKEVFYWRE
jgi:hypothetical protein